MARKIPISFTLDPALVERLRGLVRAQGGPSLSALVERLLRGAIDNEAMAVSAFANPLVRDALLRAFVQPEVITGLGKALGQELSDEQLHLFHGVLNQMSTAATVVKALPDRVLHQPKTKGKKHK